MYFARTLLVPVLLISGLVGVASAQHKYVFPQFVFGGGWASTLMVQGHRHTHNLYFFCTGPLSHDVESFRQQFLRNFHTADLRNERVDDPKDSDPAEHGGLVWHGGS